MDKRSWVVLIGIIVVVGGLFAYFYRGSSRDYFYWYERYERNTEEPYDVSVIYKLLDDYFPGHSLKLLDVPMHMRLPDADSGANYVFIGNRLYLDDQRNREALLAFVSAGNNAFISANGFPDNLVASIGLRPESEIDDYPYGEPDYYDDYEYEETEEYEYDEDSIAVDTVYIDSSETVVSTEEPYTEVEEPEEWEEDVPMTIPLVTSSYDSVAGLNFRKKPFRLQKNYEIFLRQSGNKNGLHTWSYFNKNGIHCTDCYQVRGVLNDTVPNFIEVQYGRGKFYLHTTPLAFTNYHLLRPDGVAYAERVLSHLPDGHVYWDAFHDRPTRDRFGNSYRDSPLNFILNNKGTRWAWYLLLGMVVVYFIFHARRKARIIPILESNANTSLEFIRTIGRLYFLERNDRNLADQKMKHFLNFVRRRYGLSTSQPENVLAEKIAQRSEVPLEDVKSIFNQYRTISKSEHISENWLMLLHEDIEAFYQKAK